MELNSGDFESIRTLAKAKAVAYAKEFFARDLKSLISDPKDRAELYHQASLFVSSGDINEKMLKYTVECFVYENSMAFSKLDFAKAKLWASDILKEQNMLFTAPQIMKAFADNESAILSPNTDTGVVLAKLFDAGIEPEKPYSPSDGNGNSKKPAIGAGEDVIYPPAANL